MEKAAPSPLKFENSKALFKHFQGSAKTENRIITLFGLLQVGLTISFAFLVAQLLQSLLFTENPKAPDSLFWLLALGSLLGRVVCEHAQIIIGNRASRKIRSALREYCLERCNELNIGLYPKFSATELTNLLTKEIDSLRVFFSDYVAQKRLAMFMPLAVLVSTSFIGWLVPLILALTAPLIPVFMIMVGHKAADASRKNLDQLNRLGTLLADRLKNIAALQIAGTTTAETDKIYQQSDQFRQSTMKVLRLAFLSGTLLEFFAAISVALVAVYLGLFYLDKYHVGIWGADLTLAHGVFLLMLAPEFYLPLRKLGTLYHAKAEAQSVAEHILSLEALAAEQSSSRVEQTAFPQLPETFSLSLSNAQAGSDEQTIHHPISFQLKAGEKLLIKGPSGSGKTSLLDTLAGLRPLYHGEISIDDQPVNLFQQADWFKQVGYMSQKPELLFASIRQNLCLGRTFSDEDLFSALQQAHIADTVKQLPEQLDYQITDTGGFLSGGQAQRIALARVFLHRPKLLLLDEPTASLDQDTAEEFLQSLQTYCQSGGMLIMASHRPADHRFFSQEIHVSSCSEPNS